MSTESSKRIVLTGASRGLGLAMALGFAQRGHRVWACARSVAAIEQLQKRLGRPHCCQIVDVVDDDATRVWAESMLTDGAPDLLINNAALINGNAPLWQVSAAEFSAVIDVNIKGVANVIRHFAPAMVARRQGVIVNFSSGWGRTTSARVAPYCATKFAVEGLTQALAQELPADVAAVALNPGIIATDMLRSCFGAGADGYPAPDRWAQRAVPLLLSLGRKDNGASLSVGDLDLADQAE